MAKLREIEIPFKEVINLIKQLDLKQKYQVIREIVRDEEYWRNFYVSARKLAEEKGFASMSEKELDGLLHEK